MGQSRLRRRGVRFEPRVRTMRLTSEEDRAELGPLQRFAIRRSYLSREQPCRERWTLRMSEDLQWLSLTGFVT